MMERKTLCILWKIDCCMKTETTSLTEIQARIYLVRGVQVMIDRDLVLCITWQQRLLIRLLSAIFDDFLNASCSN